jgi:hypothetical protein
MRAARTLTRWLAVAAVVAIAALLLLAGLVLEREPGVSSRPEVTPDEVARVVALLRAQDPRRGPPGAMRLVLLGGRELELLLEHAARRWPDTRLRVALARGEARVQASAALPAGFWLNVDLQLVALGGLPQIHRLRVGRLPVPGAVARPLLQALLAQQPYGAELLDASRMVRRVSFAPGRVIVAYVWDPEATRRVLGSLATEDDASRWRAYQEGLARTTETLPPGEPIAMSALLAPLAELAAARSRDGNDPAAENRALLLLLTLHANGRAPERLLPEARDWPVVHPLHIVLDGRGDVAQHFLVSAAIAIDGTSPLSRAVGVYKEMADARRGSGFSFNDLAADRAGTRLGELALAQPVEVQRRLRALRDDRELMPRWDDLPEYLSEAEFRRRFGAVGAPAYEHLLAEIDRRVAALAVMR